MIVSATVRTWESGGTALLDDGTQVVLPRESLQDSPFRFLRPGQRVRLTVVDDVVVHVDL